MRFCFRLAWAAGITAAVLLSASADLPRRVGTSVVRTDARSGKLVRGMSVTSTPVAARVIAPVVVAPLIPAADSAGNDPAPHNIDEAVERIAAQHLLPPLLIHSVIKVESNYNSAAVSSKGAQGLMQLIPATARRFGVANVFNPVDNIQGGARYLRYLLDLYNGNYPLALAAYNAGEAAVARFGGIPPYPETQNYLLLVRKQLENARKTHAARQQEKENKAVEPKRAGTPNHIQEVTEADGTVRYVSR